MRLRLIVEAECDTATVEALPRWIEAQQDACVDVIADGRGVYGVIVGAVPVEPDAVATIVADRCEDFGGRFDFDPLGGAAVGKPTVEVEYVTVRAVDYEGAKEVEREWCRQIIDVDTRDQGDGRLLATLANMAGVRLCELEGE